jgi:type IV pilus assembly protein PilX
MEKPMKTFIGSHSPEKQRGAVLVTSLVFLVILTLLAVTSMSTSTLEERMSASSQEINRAFQAAETGVELAMNDEEAFNTNHRFEFDGTANDTYDKTESNIGQYNAETEYNAVYVQKTRPPRGSRWDSGFSLYHFDVSGSGRTATGASTTIHAGAWQVGPDAY